MIFLRHPSPRVEPGTCYGRLDLDIAEEGAGQIAHALETTPRFTHLLASPALRCRALAQALCERESVRPVFDERLWEMDMGAWEGRAWRDIPLEETAEWIKDPVNLPTPGGESFLDLQRRVAAAIAEADHASLASTVVVCHAGPIRAMQMAWNGLSFREAFAAAPPYSEPIELHPPESGPSGENRKNEDTGPQRQA